MNDGQDPVGMKIQFSQLFLVQMHKPMQVCYTDPKKLVHIGRENGHELKPFTQRHLVVLGLKQDPLVEFQPRDFPVVQFNSSARPGLSNQERRGWFSPSRWHMGRNFPNNKYLSGEF
jgi:hypothetical protein